ncbi:penicillin-binding protein 1C [Sulfitobacter sabulilitoris]|uniref:peptidoglycan glycosyltransferase n=1 Tax=Sulfitobacter sabulilitoris TaxID=2562655 RepID=A0A5S3PEL9_9RHOB|nr:penicillin-binding protein 1C [Sulfitobacter sabulilitoris]TMM52467.1 penicillin-binding protein 1C [Sulfitobacter sabulilitoris]
MRRLAPFACVALLLIAAAGRDGFDRWVDATRLPPLLSETSVEMRDRNGALLRSFPVEDGRQRLAVRLGDVDPEFLAMLIAYEDKRFFRHQGIDFRALLRAGLQALRQGRVVSGGSTLTMQVARLLENSGTGRWAGKLRQMRVALALERRLGKNDILALYLNHAPYGGAVEGLRAGAHAWFGKPPARLTAAQSALLVALPQAPESRRPDRHPDAARAARDRVLHRLGQAPQPWMPDVPRAMQPVPRSAPHLTDRARRAAPGLLRHDLTLDAGLQRQMQHLAALSLRDQVNAVSAAILVADHHSGEILASVGAPRYTGEGGALGFNDMTRAIRSPGSTLKPLIYALAFDQGLVHPETLIDDAPVTFGTYAPQNFDGQFRGEITVRRALQLSLNIPPVRLMNDLGPARVMAAQRQGGATPALAGKAAPGLAIALGGVGLSLTDLVQLYAGLAQGGQGPRLHWRLGEVPPMTSRMVSRAAAWQVGRILSDIPPPQGAASRAGRIAYKTGTSYGHRDAWAIGYDGRHVIGIWLGRPDGTPVPGAFGGDLAAPILFEAFGRIAGPRAPLPAPPPETLIVTAAELPAPLRRFRPRTAAFAPAPGGPVVAFPPDGAVLARAQDGVPLKVRDGVLPLTVLVDGQPHATALMRRDAVLPQTGPGFSRLTVIDAAGRSATVQVWLD